MNEELKRAWNVYVEARTKQALDFQALRVATEQHLMSSVVAAREMNKVSLVIEKVLENK
jgi:hypothetical protein